jgi:hypothetical protein
MSGQNSVIKRNPRRSSRARTRAPRPGPRTPLTGTTRHRSQRHRAENGQARDRSPAPPQPHSRDGRDGPRTAGEPLLKLTTLPCDLGVSIKELDEHLGHADAAFTRRDLPRAD